MKAERIWTPERIEQARRLYLQADPVLSREDIAAMLGVSFYALRTALTRPDRIGIPRGARPGVKRGWAKLSDPAASPYGRVVVQRHRLQCLGPLQPPHKFWSSDPVRERVCNRCRRHLAGVIGDV